MESFKLKNDCVNDDNGPWHNVTIFDYSHECNAAAKQLIKLPTDNSNTDYKNGMTFCNVANNGSEICKSKQNYKSCRKLFI